MFRTLSAALLVVVAALVAGRAVAQPSASTDRKILIGKCLEARKNSEHQEALDCALQLEKQGENVSVLHFVAEEALALGHHDLQAFRYAYRCVHAPKEPIDTSKMREECARFQTTLEPRIALVQIDPGVAPPGLVVELDGEPLPAAALGVPYPVMPGPVEVAATAPGRQPFAARLALGKGQRALVTLALPLLPPPPCPPGTQRGAAVSGDCVAIRLPPAPPPPAPWWTFFHSHPRLTLVASAGAAAVLGTGIALWGASDAEYNHRSDVCRAGCPRPEIDASVRKVEILQDAGIAGMVVGGIVLATVVSAYLFGARPTVDPVARTAALSWRWP